MFDDYVKNKRIAIIGPARYFKDAKKVIKEYDLIVRINHVRGRTDILYHGVWKAFRKRTVTKKIDADIAPINSNVKWLVFRNSPWQVRAVNRIAKKIKIPYTVIEPEYHYFFRQICPSPINTGTAALIHLLSFDIKELAVFGFDFYRSGVFAGYGDCREPQTEEDRGKNSHNTEAQIKYLAQIKDERFQPDDVLKSILEAGNGTH